MSRQEHWLFSLGKCGGEWPTHSPGNGDLKMSFHKRSWKALRVEAINLAITLQNQATIRDRMRINAIELTIGLVWLLQGIYSRPDDGTVGREIMLRILPITNDYNGGNLMFLPSPNRNEDVPVPFCRYGAVFLAPLKWPPEVPAPRLSPQNRFALHDRCYLYYFGLTYFSLHSKLVKTGFAPQPTIRMRKGITRPHQNRRPDPMQNFERLPVKFPQPEVDMDDDLEVESLVLPERNRDPANACTLLWLRFLTDILQKCGNSKEGEAYCRLTMADRETATEETYKDLDLSKVFTRVQWKHASNEDIVTAFQRFWPRHDHVLPASAQHFRQMGYYVEWKSLASSAGSRDFKNLRRMIFDRFSSLSWIPEPLKDRVWQYDVDRSYDRLPTSSNSTERAPKVLIFGDNIPTWGHEEEGVEGGQQAVEEQEVQGLRGEFEVRRMEDYVHLRQEEEESSEGS
jgi:hypothetical protein